MSTGVVLIFHFKLISQSMIKVILDTNIKVTNKNIAILYLDLFGALLAFKKNMVNIIMIIKKIVVQKTYKPSLSWCYDLTNANNGCFEKKLHLRESVLLRMVARMLYRPLRNIC